MAGVAGFEPANAGTKNRCLTTWRHPSSPSLIGSGERPYSVQKPLGNKRFGLIYPVDPSIGIGCRAALNFDQFGAQFLGELTGAAAADREAAL